MTISVLMSTYYRENPDYLDAAMKSIWTEQTRKPDQIVLVEDGPLTQQLDVVVEKWKNAIGASFTVVANNQNKGLSYALNDGLAYCKGDVVVRMDTDDLAYPARIEEEVRCLDEHPDISVVGSWIVEFVDSTDNVVSIKKAPETSEQIFRFGKKRNPVNHPSVAFRKDVIVNNGGYPHFYLFEDYCLWVTLLSKGVRFYNIQKPLLWFRVSKDMYARRGGMKYAMSELKVQRYIHQIGYITFYEMVRNCCMRSLGRLIPNSLRGYIYKKLLRE